MVRLRNCYRQVREKNPGSQILLAAHSGEPEECRLAMTAWGIAGRIMISELDLDHTRLYLRRTRKRCLAIAMICTRIENFQFQYDFHN